MIPASNLIISIPRRELCMTSESSSSNLVMWNHLPHRKFTVGNILEHRDRSWKQLSTIVAGCALSSSSLAPVVINRQSSVSLVASVLASGGRCRFPCLKRFPLRVKLHWKHSSNNNLFLHLRSFITYYILWTVACYYHFGLIAALHLRVACRSVCLLHGLSVDCLLRLLLRSMHICSKFMSTKKTDDLRKKH